MRADRCGKQARKAGDQQTFRYLGRNQDERAVTAVLTQAAVPADPGPAKARASASYNPARTAS